MQRTKRERTERFEKEHDCTRFHNVVLKYGQGWKKLLRNGELHIVEDGFVKYILNSDITKIEDYTKRENVWSASDGEREVREYVQSLTDSEILYNKRNIITKPNKIYELDIFVPSKNVAIEYNGIYWHSTKVVPNDYHLTKHNLCADKGIRLIHIFEDEWKWKREICKSIITSSFNIYKEKYFARKCIAQKIDAQTYRNFVNSNHIAGAINSKYKYGLFYNNELVQVIGIGQSRFKKGELELHRMCSKLFTNVIGGFSKLLKFAANDIKKETNTDSIDLYSYVDLAKFNGNGYEKSGFTYICTTKPSYFYVANNLIHKNRMQFQKSKLPKLLDNFDSNLTEQENVVNNGYYCVYDCGNKKFKMIL